MTHAIRALLQRPIAYHRIFATLTGSVTAGVLLSQMCYWADGRQSDPEGWVWKSAREWETETGLSRKEQRTARKRLNEFDWWQEKTARVRGAPTVHYRLDLDKLYASIEELVAPKPEPAAEEESSANPWPNGTKDQTDQGPNGPRPWPNGTEALAQLDQSITETTQRPLSETTREGETTVSVKRVGADNGDGPPAPAPEGWDFDGGYGKPARPTNPEPVTGTLAKLRRPKTSLLFDPQKLASGYCPSGEGDNAYEVYREFSNRRLSRPQIEKLNRRVDDLDKWREVVEEYIDRGYAAGNLKNMLTIYTEGWRDGDRIRANGPDTRGANATTSAQNERLVGTWMELNQYDTSAGTGVDVDF